MSPFLQGFVPSDRIVVFAIGGAPELSRWATDIAKKGFLTRNGIFSFLIGNFDCLAIRVGGAFRPSLNRQGEAS